MSLPALARRGLVALVVAAVPACFDWDLRVDPGPPDGAFASEGGVVGDGASAEGSVSPEDAGPDGAVACDVLVADIATAREKARRCTLGAGQCVAKIVDECDCELFVAVETSPETTALKEKIALAGGCRDHCASCPFLPTQGTCLSQTGGNTCSP